MESLTISKESQSKMISFQPKDKLKLLPELGEILFNLRSQDHKVVHCHGVFDLVHPGHIRHLAAAKREGDILVVTLTPDRFVNKGPGRPVFTEQLRAESLAALQCVDFVAINEWATAIETIQILKPDVYVKGSDYIDREKDVSGKINDEEAKVIEMGGRIHFTDDITFSSSALLNNYLSVYSPEVDAYLHNLRKKYSASEVISALETLKSMTVMVVGEAILDEYVYGDTLGKSAKEPILALRYLSREIHVGGSVVIANHLADFCKRVVLVTYLGEEDSREDFIKQSLKPNVQPSFIYKPNSPTIVKRRFVDKYQVTKLLEFYEMNDEPLSGSSEEMLCQEISQHILDCDAVIAADFGHGLITQDTVNLLCREARFLAVNTQINAANNGFHTLSRYPKADYVCVHEGEVRLDQRRTRGELRPLVEQLAERMSSRSVMVTQGKTGTLHYRAGQGFCQTPSLAIKVVDRVGAGDSVLAISSLCEAARLPEDLVGFIANLVGAQAVNIVGNSTAIDKVGLYKAIEALMK